MANIANQLYDICIDIQYCNHINTVLQTIYILYLFLYSKYKFVGSGLRNKQKQYKILHIKVYHPLLTKSSCLNMTFISMVQISKISNTWSIFPNCPHISYNCIVHISTHTIQLYRSHFHTYSCIEHISTYTIQL